MTNVRGRNWFITLNNPGEVEPILDRLRRETLFFTGQLEVGASGTPHLQLVLNLKQAQRLAYVTKLLPGCHAEVCRDVESSITYCTKEDTRVQGPWTHGETPEVRVKDNWALTVKKAKLMSEEELQDLPPHQYISVKKALSLVPIEAYSHDDVRGIWYYGEPGAGKSRRAFEENPGAFRKAQNKWFDGYKGEHCIILDDLDLLGGQTLGHYLKIWGDRYACTGEVKGSTVGLAHRRIIVTSNYTPEQIWPEDTSLVAAIRRRYKMINIIKL